MSSSRSQHRGQSSPSNSGSDDTAPAQGTSRSAPSQTGQPSQSPPSYMRPSSGRPKLHLQPPGTEDERANFFQGLTAPQEPNKAAEVTLPRSGVAQAQELSTAAHSHPRGSVDAGENNWWTFTLPAEAIRKVDQYWHSRNNSESANGQEEKLGDPEKSGGDPDLPSSTMNQSFSARIGSAFGQSSTSTPWMAPWTPFRGPSMQYEHGLQDPDALQEHARNQSDKQKKTVWGRLQNFFLFSAFAPFWCRFINLAFTVTVLGLAVKIYIIQTRAGFDGLIGISTVLIIVIGPLSVVHIFGALFFEYFGAPVGVASVSTKMMYTLLDLLFVALWSAILAITFDDYFTSNAQCTTWTPYGEWRGTTPFNPSDVPDTVCDLQLSLLVLNFLSVILYQGVLIISLFRIFKKVSRPSG